MNVVQITQEDLQNQPRFDEEAFKEVFLKRLNVDIGQVDFFKKDEIKNLSFALSIHTVPKSLNEFLKVVLLKNDLTVGAKLLCETLKKAKTQQERDMAVYGVEFAEGFRQFELKNNVTLAVENLSLETAVKALEFATKHALTKDAEQILFVKNFFKFYEKMNQTLTNARNKNIANCDFGFAVETTSDFNKIEASSAVQPIAHVAYLINQQLNGVVNASVSRTSFKEESVITDVEEIEKLRSQANKDKTPYDRTVMIEVSGEIEKARFIEMLDQVHQARLSFSNLTTSQRIAMMKDHVLLKENLRNDTQTSFSGQFISFTIDEIMEFIAINK